MPESCVDVDEVVTRVRISPSHTSVVRVNSLDQTVARVAVNTSVVRVSTFGVPLAQPGGDDGDILVHNGLTADWHPLVVTGASPPAQGDFVGQVFIPS